MANFRPTNNNQQRQQLTVNVYSPISLIHPNSQVQDTRFSISYFNKVMVLSISKRMGNGNDISYDNENSIKCYVSYMKAKMLADDIKAYLKTGIAHNVSVELKDCMLKISDGSEYGSNNYCISIIKADERGARYETVYETNPNNYQSCMNYDVQNGSYEAKIHSEIEIDTFIMCLEQYYLASSYALAATVRESGMYKDKYVSDTITAIAGKVGVTSYERTGNGTSANFNKTFLSGGPRNEVSSSFKSGPVPKEYEQTTFEDIAEAIG